MKIGGARGLSPLERILMFMAYAPQATLSAVPAKTDGGPDVPEWSWHVARKSQTGQVLSVLFSTAALVGREQCSAAIST